MARDTSEITEDLAPGTSTPDPETTLEALIRAYNRLPLDTDLDAGDLGVWDGTDWVTSGLNVADDGLVAQDGAGGLELVGRDTYAPAFVARAAASEWIPPLIQLTNATLALTNERVEFTPIVIPDSETYVAIGCQVSGAGEAGSTLRMGLYEQGSDGKPGSLLVDGGTVAADSTGDKTVTISQAPGSGLYWIGVVAQSATTTPPTVRAGELFGFPLVYNNLTNMRAGNKYRQDSVGGALPDPPTLAYTAGALVVAGLQRPA